MIIVKLQSHLSSIEKEKEIEILLKIIFIVFSRKEKPNWHVGKKSMKRDVWLVSERTAAEVLLQEEVYQRRKGNYYKRKGIHDEILKW